MRRRGIRGGKRPSSFPQAPHKHIAFLFRGPAGYLAPCLSFGQMQLESGRSTQLEVPRCRFETWLPSDSLHHLFKPLRLCGPHFSHLSNGIYFLLCLSLRAA